MDSEKGGRRGEWGTFDSRGIVGVTFLTKTRSTHLHYEFKGTPCICGKVSASPSIKDSSACKPEETHSLPHILENLSAMSVAR